MTSLCFCLHWHIYRWRKLDSFHWANVFSLKTYSFQAGRQDEKMQMQQMELGYNKSIRFLYRIWERFMWRFLVKCSGGTCQRCLLPTLNCAWMRLFEWVARGCNRRRPGCWWPQGLSPTTWLAAPNRRRMAFVEQVSAGCIKSMQ